MIFLNERSNASPLSSAPCHGARLAVSIPR